MEAGARGYAHLLPNRRLLTDHLERLLLRGDNAQGAIFFIDLDRLKSVNNSLGHAFGDELLQQVAARQRALLQVGPSVSVAAVVVGWLSFAVAGMEPLTGALGSRRMSAGLTQIS